MGSALEIGLTMGKKHWSVRQSQGFGKHLSLRPSYGATVGGALE